MGSPPSEWGRGLNNETQHEVRLTHRFAMLDHELTLHEWGLHEPPPDLTWISALDAGPYACTLDDCPMVDASWFDALRFANDLSQAEGLEQCYVLDGCSSTRPTSCSNAAPVKALYDCGGYRLPTEAEWEYAARAGSQTAFWTGDIRQVNPPAGCKDPDPNLDPVSWYCVNANNTTHPVRKKQANPFGLFDMLGNVDEYVNDAYEYYGDAAVDPLVWLNADGIVVTRGGIASVWSQLHRSARRGFVTPGTGGSQAGFRLVRTLKDVPLGALVDMTVVASTDGGGGG